VVTKQTFTEAADGHGEIAAIVLSNSYSLALL